MVNPFIKMVKQEIGLDILTGFLMILGSILSYFISMYGGIEKLWVIIIFIIGGGLIPLLSVICFRLFCFSKHEFEKYEEKGERERIMEERKKAQKIWTKYKDYLQTKYIEEVSNAYAFSLQFGPPNIMMDYNVNQTKSDLLSYYHPEEDFELLEEILNMNNMIMKKVKDFSSNNDSVAIQEYVKKNVPKMSSSILKKISKKINNAAKKKIT